MKFLKFLVVFALFQFTFISCGGDDSITEPVETEIEDPDPIDDPDPIILVEGDPDEILEFIQSRLYRAMQKINTRTMYLTRQRYQRGAYADKVVETSSVNYYSFTYTILQQIQILSQLNIQENGNLRYHLGVAQVIQAYAFFTSVDLYGDVPYSQALNSEMFPYPMPDSGEAVYEAHIQLLNEAITNLSANTSATPPDIFYGNFSSDKWISLANTLKIRANVNLLLTDPTSSVNEIINLLSEDIIDSSDEDFTYSFNNDGSGEYNFLYFDNYSSTVNDYLSNNLYDLMNTGDINPPFIENGAIDPRARYYFYRQTDIPPSGSRLPCEAGPNSSIYDYCYVGNLYWGRDHGDTEGFPNDGARKTTWGIYPIGGAFDANIFVRARDAQNQLFGKGIYPFYLSSYTSFALAEASVRYGSIGNPRNFLEDGMRKSFDKVKGFANNVMTNGLEMQQQDIDNYVNAKLTEFDSANQAGKLELISFEFYIALFGNGLEAYNLYRRTGFPDLQTLIENPDSFPRNFAYPISVVLLNPNINEQPVTKQVFWDNNPPGFID